MKAITQPQPAPETNPRGRKGRKGRKRGRKGRRRNPTKNPSALTWVLIAGGSAVAIGGLGALYIRRRNRKAITGGTTPGTTGGTTPGTTGGDHGGGTTGGGGGSKNYVGSNTGWTGWPHKDTFPTASTMIVVMGTLGYPMSGNFMDTPSPQSVKQFELDYNKVAKTPGLSPAGSQVTPDKGPYGLMGAQNVNALYNALQWTQLKPWSQLKQEAP